MLSVSAGKFAAAAAVAAATTVGAMAPANAIIVSGNWDPQFGAPFNAAGSELGWQGRADWLLPDACVPGAGTVLNGAPCSGGAMTLIGATVEFYNFSVDPLGNNPVDTLTFGSGSASVLSMNLSGSSVLGVNTSLSTAVTPTSSFAGVNGYSFALQFTGSDVRLFYALNGQALRFTSAGLSYLGEHDEDDDDDECEGKHKHKHKHKYKCAPKPCSIGDLAAPRCGVNNGRDFPAPVRFTTSVPEPQTYALMLIGLAALSFAARRRQRDLS